MRERSPIASLLSAATTLASLLVLTAWCLRVITRRNWPSPSGFGSVANLDGLGPLSYEPWVLVAVGVAAMFVLLRHRSLANPRTAAGAAILTLITIAASLLTSFGYYMVLAAASSVVALLIGLQLPAASTADHTAPSTDRRVAAGLWLGVAAIMCLFCMYRHSAYGSGSWDMGCMIHNFYRASHFHDSTSTVLGDVDFLGDHFMIGIYLYAPLFWLNATGYMLIFVQSVNLAATAPAIYLIARHRKASPFVAIALALATGLSFGIQSAAYFDSHEIVVGFGFLAWGLWAFETGRLKTATALFFTFALFKESLGAYVLALGLLAIWRGLRGSDADDATTIDRRRWVAYGVIWIVGGAIWFVMVNRVFMPMLIARANAPEPHETFADFGPTVFSALLGIVQQPVKAVGALFVPADKMQSQLVTLGGVGWLALAAPEILIAASPLIAERFLSSKTTMWEMGYHYAAPLCLYAGWAAAVGWPRVHRGLEAVLDRMGDWLGDRAPGVAAVYLLICLWMITGVGYRHPANFYKWNMVYFSTAERREAHDEAIDLLRGLDRGERLAAQNRLLPHLADRPVIYRLGDWAKADWVLLSVGENAWPWDDGFPKRLARILGRDAAFKLVFSKGSTAIFARKAVTEMPPVKASAALGLGP